MLFSEDWSESAEVVSVGVGDTAAGDDEWADGTIGPIDVVDEEEEGDDDRFVIEMAGETIGVVDEEGETNGLESSGPRTSSIDLGRVGVTVPFWKDPSFDRPGPGPECLRSQ